LIKELKKELAFLIISHFLLLDKKPDFSNFVLVPVPLSKKKLKWRGFNQAEEIAKELANFLKIPLISDCLIKTKETKDQVELSEKERKENVKGAFYIKNKEKIAGKNVLLVDDVFTTGATMEEAAKVLKEAGSEKIVGVVVAKASPGQDKLT
jgi:ComF family protein